MALERSEKAPQDMRLLLLYGKTMDNLDDKIRNVLFDIGKDIKIHKIDNDNMVIEIDYDRYVLMIKGIIQAEIEEQI